MATQESSALRLPESHPHFSGEVCPLCDQPIPTDKLVEIQQRERDRARAQEKTLRAELEGDKVAAIAKKDKELAALRIEQDSTVTSLKDELETREASAKLVGKKEAEEALTERMTKAETDKATAETQLASIKDEQQQDKADAKKQITAAKLEGQKVAEKAAGEKLKSVEASRDALDEQLKAEKATSKQLTDETVQKALQAQRESLENDKTSAVQKEQTKAFEERQKLTADLARLQIKVDKQRANELGEAAELDLFSALQETFSGDGIRRIDKGVAGADIWHDVKFEGYICGRIIYDSKNRGAWRNEYVDKLKDDQLAAKGDYAVLATRVFPAGVKQLTIKDGVIIAHPARVIPIVTLLREHIIQSHRLRLSSEARDVKTKALYEFLTSERCRQIFEHLETLTEDLLELDVSEIKQHEKTWSKRGQLIKKTQKAIQIQLRGEIDRLLQDGSSV